MNEFSDFVSNSVELGLLSPYAERASFLPVSFESEKFPDNFPENQWATQSARYAQLWNWYSGHALADTKQDTNGQLLSQYPLHINTLRAFVRKHAAVLFGEVPDGAAPLVKTVVKPRKRFDGSPTPEADKQLAETCQNILNDIWTQSYGRAMQMENGKFSQYLGGSIFEVDYEPNRTDLSIPLVIHNPRPDFFLPEWSNENYWSLLRSTTLYRIPATQAKMQYNIGSGLIGQDAIYCKTRTAEKYSVTIDGTPLPLKGDILQKNLPNPFEMTTAIYIPHIREGQNYGSTHVEDVAALLKEYNGRMADLGSAVLETTDRQIYFSNIYGDKITPIKMVNGKTANSLGITPAASGSKDAPSVHEGIASPISPTMIEYTNMVFQQMLRDCDLSGIPFGEDSGSQRSGATLALRMWPLLSHTRSERTYWNDGLTRLAHIILKMVRTLQTELLPQQMASLGIKIPEDYEKRIEISVEWSPQIPQDRAQLIMELAQLKAAKLISTRQAVTRLGDVKDIDEELDAIKADETLAADLASQGNQPFGGGKPSNGAASPSSSNGTTPKEATAKASSAISSVN